MNRPPPPLSRAASNPTTRPPPPAPPAANPSNPFNPSPNNPFDDSPSPAPAPSGAPGIPPRPGPRPPGGPSTRPPPPAAPAGASSAAPAAAAPPIPPPPSTASGVSRPAVPSLPTTVRPVNLVSAASDDTPAPQPAAAAAPAAAPMSDAEKAEKKERMRTKVAAEISSTEISYVESLHDAIELYIRPLRSLARDTDKSILSDSEITSIFSNLEEIQRLNTKFRDDLAKRIEQWTSESTISDLFLEYAPFFKIYQVYVSNHERASQLVRQLEKSNSKFAEFCQKALCDPRAKSTPLQSYLIMPIQRVPRYQLLLQELERQTVETQREIVSGNLRKAISTIAAIAKSINEAVRAAENRAAIIEIQEKFSPALTLITPSRRFLRQGTLSKQCRSYDKQYEFLLFNDLLLYAQKSVTGKLKLNRQLDIDIHFRVEDLLATNEREFQWQIVSSKKSFIVYVPDADTKSAWMADFQMAIQERDRALEIRQGATGGAGAKSNSASKSNSTSGGAAPVWKSDHSSKHCSICQTEFTLFNRRHHCRRCGDLVCDSCSKQRMQLSNDPAAKPERVCEACVAESRYGITRENFLKQLKGESVAAAAVVANANKPPAKGEESDDDESPGPLPNMNQTPAKPAPPIPQRPRQQGSRYRAVFTYQAQNAADLTFAVGDVITVSKKDPSGWWVGSVNGSPEGVFPANYVEEVIEGDSSNGESTGTVSGFGAAARGTLDFHVIVIAGYKKTNPQEMDLFDGEIIHVIAKDGANYYYGTNVRSNVAGWFPCANVQETKHGIEKQQQQQGHHAHSASISHSRNSSSTPASGAGRATVGKRESKTLTAPIAPDVEFSPNAPSLLSSVSSDPFASPPPALSSAAGNRSSASAPPMKRASSLQFKVPGAPTSPTSPNTGQSDSGSTASIPEASPAPPPAAPAPTPAPAPVAPAPTPAPAAAPSPPPAVPPFNPAIAASSVLSVPQPSKAAPAPPAVAPRPVPGTVPAPKASSSTGSGNPCSNCDCNGFVAQAFQKQKCKICFHHEVDHK